MNSEGNSRSTDGGLALTPRHGPAEFKPETEIIRKLIQILSDDGAEELEELKKVRLISKSWYESVGELYRTEPGLGQKYLAHFDGEERSFVQSANFGRNLSGFYNLDFNHLKVSQSEWYLMRVWLRLNNLNMIQNLELKDNLLSWQEVIQVLAKFPSIVNFKYNQSANEKTCLQIFNSYESQFVDFFYHNDIEGVKKIQEYFATHGLHAGFLPNLKSVEMDIVHVKISNIIALILSASQGQLEEFIVAIDHMGMFNGIKKGAIVRFHELNMGWFKYMGNFAPSMKKFEIAIESSGGVNCRVQNIIAGKIFEIFETRDMEPFTEIEKLVIKIPMIDGDFACPGLEKYVRSLDKLTRFHLELLTEQVVFKSNKELKDGTNTFKFLKTLIPKRTDCTATLGLYTSAETGLESVGIFAEHVTKLEICPNETCIVRPDEMPVYVNCSDLEISWNYIDSQYWPNIGVPVICTKFPNLQKLTLFRMGNSFKTQAQLKDADLQLIIGHYQNLRSLELGNCVRFITDAGLTGLTSTSLENQLYGNLEDKASVVERNGLPISHLKELEVLSIKSYSQEIDDVTNVTAQFGFEDMPKLRSITFMNTNITIDGINMILDKTKSQSLTISSQNEIMEPIL